MQPLIALLSLYYLCDQAAAAQGLAPPQVRRCMSIYEAVKRRFADAPLAPSGTPARAAQTRQAYAAFKAWEEDHPALVAALKAEARARLDRR